jgi:flavorubredoxin
MDFPTMGDPINVAADTWVLPTAIPIPGMGILNMNPMVIKGEQPVLIDTCAPILRDEYLRRVFDLVEPDDVRWIFLSHDDRDHSGNIIQVLERCPNARLISNFVGIGRMGEEWQFPMPRVYFANDGDRFDAGDRELVAIRPPFFDSPATRGLWDSSTGMYFSADAFGAVIPEQVGDARDVSAEAYAEGFNWFNRANHPWHVLTDPNKVDAAVDVIRKLDAQVIVSTHGPAATGISQKLCDMLSAVSTMEPLPLPDQAALEQMLAAASAAGAA